MCYKWGKKEGKNVCWGLLSTMFCPFTTTTMRQSHHHQRKWEREREKKNVEIKKKVTCTWNADIPGIVCIFVGKRENTSGHVARINANEFAMISYECVCSTYASNAMCEHYATHRLRNEYNSECLYPTQYAQIRSHWIFNTVYIEFFSSFFLVRVYRFRKWFELPDSMFLLLLLFEVGFLEIHIK